MERIGSDTLHFSCQHAYLALPLGELSPQVTERALQRTLSVLAALGHLSQRERQEQAQRMIPLCLLSISFVYCRPLPDLTLSNSASICASGSAVQRETMTMTSTLKINAGSSS